MAKETKSSICDLNEYLFEAMDRLTNDDLSPEQLELELKRADSLSKIATNIISNGELAYRVMAHMDEYGYNDGKNAPLMLQGVVNG